MFLVLQKANSGALNAFPFTYQFIEWELFLVVQDELYQNVGLSLLAVFIITLALIAHPGTSLLVFLSIGMTIADLLGLMWYVHCRVRLSTAETGGGRGMWHTAHALHVTGV